MRVSHTLKGNENAFPKLGARLKARDSSNGLAAVGISWLGPVRLARRGGTRGMRAPGDE